MRCTDVIGTDANEQAMVPAPLSPNSENSKAGTRISLNERRRIFRQIIVKCVLQLLLIETTNDLLRNDEVYNTIPPEHLLRLMGVLDHSYQFARMFNDDKELRTGLWKVGGLTSLFLVPCDDLRSYVVCRLHEASAQPVEARIEQRVHFGACASADVL